jgi:toxin-antitoxin system PIN domain toxin
VKLLDANVWLAAAWVNHAQHQIARKWLDRVEDELAWCRITQMAFLRLTTNHAILGRDCLTRQRAWGAYDAFLVDARVRFLNEPEGLVPLWLSFSKREDHAHQLWTDDYLAAFAQAAAATLVTFDGPARSRYPSVSVSVLR